ncbi:MAG: hypothetical protein PHO02_00695 [Candidatus Nanoarchaeia archaeon]|nr:hypothetical protein [Candidatus Nanoarchaeia archaeon]
MIGSIFQEYQCYLNNASGTSFQFKEQVSGTLWVESKVTSVCGSPIEPCTPIDSTKFSITFFDRSVGSRVVGIDNHEHKPLHTHFCGSELLISDNFTLANAGSFGFLEFFPNYI